MCGSRVDRHMRRRGRSVSGKVASLSRSDLGYSPFLSSRRYNSSGKELKHESSCPKDPRATRVSGDMYCWICVPNYSGGGRVQGAVPSACLLTMA